MNKQYLKHWFWWLSKRRSGLTETLLIKTENFMFVNKNFQSWLWLAGWQCLVTSIFKSGSWLAGSYAASQSEARLENLTWILTWWYWASGVITVLQYPINISMILSILYTKDIKPIYLKLGPQFNTKMSSGLYRKTLCGDKTILRPSYLNNEISYTGKTTSLYWIRALVLFH